MLQGSAITLRSDDLGCKVGSHDSGAPRSETKGPIPCTLSSWAQRPPEVNGNSGRASQAEVALPSKATSFRMSFATVPWRVSASVLGAGNLGDQVEKHLVLTSRSGPVIPSPHAGRALAECRVLSCTLGTWGRQHKAALPSGG